MATRIPINKDGYTFEERQKKIWEDMEQDMERRRREWEDEISKMRKEFFLLNPDKAEFPPLEGARTTTRNMPGAIQVQDSDDGKPVIEKDEKGQPVFRVRFNMTEYKPEEINVKMDNTKIMVSAKHEEKGSGSSVSREYNREVNVPRDVDPLALSCTLNPDGYLVFQAPLPAPSYNAIKDSSSAGAQQQQQSPGVVKSTSSYSSSTVNRGGHPPPTASLPVYSQREQQHQHSNSHQQHHQQQQHQQHHQPVQQQQQARVLNVSNQQSAPKQSGYSTTKSTSYNQRSEVHEDPDVVVPSYKPPPDLSRYDIVDKPVQYQTSSSSTSSLHSAPPSHFGTSSSNQSYNTLNSGLSSQSPFASSSATASSLSQPPFGSSSAASNLSPPFGSLSSTFPTGPITSQAQLSVPLVTSQDGKFQLTMPIDDFKPEELTVKTQDGKVIICAKRQIREGNRNKTTEMSREHSLPDNVDPLTVKAFFTDTNKLIVEAPFRRS